MSVSPDVLRRQLEYHAWASGRLMDAAAALPPDELTRDFGTADQSVAGTLAHVFFADRVWLERVLWRPKPPRPEARLDCILWEWPPLLEAWRAWAANLTEAAAGEVLAYQDLSGRPWRTAVWEIVLHVVNHGTHHRGQVAGFLRSMGHTPPPLDLIAFYRGISSFS